MNEHDDATITDSIQYVATITGVLIVFSNNKQDLHAKSCFFTNRFLYESNDGLCSCHNIITHLELAAIGTDHFIMEIHFIQSV